MNAPLSTLRLYQIADAYLLALEALAETEDLAAETIADTLKGWLGTFEQKAVAVAAYIRNLELEAAAVEDARRRMERRQQSLERHAERLRTYLCIEMERTGITKVKSTELMLRTQKNPPSVVIDNDSAIPGAYQQEVITVKLLKAEIGKALKAGQQVPGVHLEQSTRLVIS
jgi:uncharacterized secreted protein with C-terminal beta-propeller domain